MPKESGKSEKKIAAGSETISKNNEVNQALIENFVSLQKVMTNLAVKFDNLSTQISKLLELFEISAKALAEKDYTIGESAPDKKVVEKLDSLLAQNKVIAKGLVLLHESNSSQNQPVQQQNNFTPSSMQTYSPQQDEIKPMNIQQSNYSKPLTRTLTPEKNFNDSKVRPMNP